MDGLKIIIDASGKQWVEQVCPRCNKIFLETPKSAGKGLQCDKCFAVMTKDLIKLAMETVGKS